MSWGQGEIPQEYSHLTSSNNYIQGYFWLDLPHQSKLNDDGTYTSVFKVVLVNDDDLGSIVSVLQNREDVRSVSVDEGGDQYIITIQALLPIQNKQWAQALVVDVGLRKVRFNNGSYSVFQYASGYRTELKKTW